MSGEQQKSTLGLKFLLASISIAGVLGIWTAFATRAQLASPATNSSDPQLVVSGELFLPEMPTLVPIIELPVGLSQQPQPAGQPAIRIVTMPTPGVQAAPAVGIEQVLVGSPSNGSTEDSSAPNSAPPAPDTSTGTSK